MRAFVLALALLLLLGAAARGDEDDKAAREALEKRVRDLEERLRRLEGGAPPSTAVPAQQPATPEQPKESLPPTSAEAAKTPEDRISTLEKASKSFIQAVVDKLSIVVMLDAAYTWNFNAPRNRIRDTQPIIVNDPDNNSFEVTWAKFLFGRPVDRDANDWDAGFVLSFGAGREAQNVISLTPGFLFHEPFNIAEAHVDFQIPTPFHPILITFGRTYGYIGTESDDTPVNPNYTVSYIFDNTPFTLTGLSIGMDLGAGFRYTQYVVNAWDLIIDNNMAKTFGGQLEWKNKDPETTITLNWIYGPEQPDNNSYASSARWLVDLDVIFNPVEGTQLRGSLLGGEEGRGSLLGRNEKFSAAQVIFRQELYEVREHFRRFAFAVRSTVYRDQGGGFTGLSQLLVEATGTFEVHFSPYAKIRFEYRHDQSSQDHAFFGRRRTLARDSMNIVAVDAAFAF